MAWTLVREYECTLCGAKEIGSSIGLPLTWRGNGDENGDCYCGSCVVKLNSIDKCRLLPLDGDKDRLVCSNCGSSFSALDLSAGGNTPPCSCPKCGLRVAKYR